MGQCDDSKTIIESTVFSSFGLGWKKTWHKRHTSNLRIPNIHINTWELLQNKEQMVFSPEPLLLSLPDFCTTFSIPQNKQAEETNKSRMHLPFVIQGPMLSGKMQTQDLVCWWLVRKTDICPDRTHNQHSLVSLRSKSAIQPPYQNTSCHEYQNILFLL